MAFTKCNFIYASEYSESYGVMICTIGDTNNHSSNDEKQNENTTKSIYNNTWDLHGVEYSEPLSFNITICKTDGSVIDFSEENALKKWLCRSNRKWLEIDSTEYSDTMFNCRFTNPTEEHVGGNVIGLTFTVKCDSPYGVSNIRRSIYTSSSTLSVNMNIFNSFADEMIYPKLTITNANGNISIANTTTNETVSINSCITSETIILNCCNDRITTTDSRNIVDAWNKHTLGLIDGNNALTLTGVFTLTMEYRIPMRVGV